MSKPSMQHRHYVFIAQIIASMPVVTHSQREIIAKAFAQALHGTNPKYDVGRFVDAALGTPCGRDKARAARADALLAKSIRMHEHSERDI